MDSQNNDDDDANIQIIIVSHEIQLYELTCSNSTRQSFVLYHLVFYHLVYFISLGIFLLRKIQIKKKYYLLSIFISAEGTISCKLLKTLLRNDWPNQQMMQQNHFSSNKYNRFKFYIFILIKIKPSPHLLSPCCSDVPNI